MTLSWENVNEDVLKHLYYDENLSDAVIAEKFGVSKNQVSYKRRKFGISIRDKVIIDVLNNQEEIMKEINEKSREKIINDMDIDAVSKAITHFAFRNGPIENMHSMGQLTEEDMKILNRFMVNRIAGLLDTMRKGEWLKLDILLHYYNTFFGTEWDKAEIDTKEIDELYEYEVNKLIKNLRHEF